VPRWAAAVASPDSRVPAGLSGRTTGCALCEDGQCRHTSSRRTGCGTSHSCCAPSVRSNALPSVGSFVRARRCRLALLACRTMLIDSAREIGRSACGTHHGNSPSRTSPAERVMQVLCEIVACADGTAANAADGDEVRPSAPAALRASQPRALEYSQRAIHERRRRRAHCPRTRSAP
jgi:hypothetical protein